MSPHRFRIVVVTRYHTSLTLPLNVVNLSRQIQGGTQRRLHNLTPNRGLTSLTSHRPPYSPTRGTTGLLSVNRKVRPVPTFNTH